LVEDKGMRKIGLFEAKQKFSELAERAERGERIGITKRGKLIAEIGRSNRKRWTSKKYLHGWTKFGKVEKAKNISVKELIEEGRK